MNLREKLDCQTALLNPENPTLEERLEAVANLLESDPGVWTQGAVFREGEGRRPIHIGNNSLIAQACAVGLYKTACKNAGDRYDARNALEESLPPGHNTLESYNDGTERTAGDIAELFRRAAGRTGNPH